MLFYKYQKSGTLEFNMLRKGEIYFASDRELNDANECRPRFVFRGSEDLWRRFARFTLERVCFSDSYYRQKSSDEIQQVLHLSDVLGRQLKKNARARDITIEELGLLLVQALGPLLEKKLPRVQSRFVVELVRNFIEGELLRILREERYMASFSRNATNPTMWGHYAGAETGFVLAYETNDGRIGVRSAAKVLHGKRPSATVGIVEVGIYRDEQLKLQEVRYGRKPPKVNAFHRLIHKFSYSEEEHHYDVPWMLGGDAPDKEESIIGLVKYSDWRYEEEVRAFFPNVGAVAPDLRVLSVSPTNIKGLIFGPRMSAADKVRAVICCYLMRETAAMTETSLPKFAFFQAQEDVDRFGFEIIPVGTLKPFYFDRVPLKCMCDLAESEANDVRTIARLIGLTRKRGGAA
jgi:hypothetical protein